MEHKEISFSETSCSNIAWGITELKYQFTSESPKVVVNINQESDDIIDRTKLRGRERVCQSAEEQELHIEQQLEDSERKDQFQNRNLQDQQSAIASQEEPQQDPNENSNPMQIQSLKLVEGDIKLYETYSKEKCLDKGNNYVFEARNRLDNSCTECIKEIRISENDNSYDQFINETHILETTKQFPHPNMIKYYGHFILSQDNHTGSPILLGNIIMEKGKQSLKRFMMNRESNMAKQPKQPLSTGQAALPQGDGNKDHIILSKINRSYFELIYSLLERKNQGVFEKLSTIFKFNKVIFYNWLDKKAFFTDVEVVEFMKSMIDVHWHLQSQNIAHRDIKPQNIIIVEEDDGNYVYKVCDVGSGVGLEGSNSNYTRTRSLAGTEIYMSPEMFNGVVNTMNPQYNPFKSDTFSLGLVFLEFCTLHRFQKRKRAAMTKEEYITELQALRRDAKKRYPYIFGLNKLLKQMLAYEPQDRLSFKEIYQQVFEQNKLTVLSSRQTQLERLSSNIFSTEDVMTKHNIMSLLDEVLSSHPPSIRIQLDSVQGNFLTEVLIKLKNVLKIVQPKRISILIEDSPISVEQAKLLGEAIGKASDLLALELLMFKENIGEQGCIQMLSNISTSCSHLKQLRLDLSNNNIQSSGVINGLVQMSKLKDINDLMLDLSQNNLQLECVLTLCEIFSSFTHLKKLDLRLAQNCITYKGVKQLKDSIGELKHLTSFQFNMSQNQFFADQGFIEVGNVIEKCTNLTELSIVVSVNQIQMKGLKEFSLCLENLKLLKNFNIFLWGNNIEGTGFQYLGKALAQLEDLEQIQLNLTNNQITTLGLSEIEKGLSNKKYLQHVNLQLEGCGLVSEDMIYLGRIMSKEKLKTAYLNIQNNKLEANSGAYIASGLQGARSLEEFSLNLSETQVGGSSHVQILKLALNCPALHSVFYSCRQCNLQDKSLDQITSLGEKLRKLKYLCLDLEGKNKVLELTI